MHILTHHTLSAASLYHWILFRSQDIHLPEVHSYIFCTCLIINWQRSCTQVLFWNYNHLWWHCANCLPSAVLFIANDASTRPLLFREYAIYSCALEKFLLMKVYFMSSVEKYTLPFPSYVSLYLLIQPSLIPYDCTSLPKTHRHIWV